jgi:hypothetical protein
MLLSYLKIITGTKTKIKNSYQIHDTLEGISHGGPVYTLLCRQTSWTWMPPNLSTCLLHQFRDEKYNNLLSLTTFQPNKNLYIKNACDRKAVCVSQVTWPHIFLQDFGRWNSMLGIHFRAFLCDSSINVPFFEMSTCAALPIL